MNAYANVTLINRTYYVSDKLGKIDFFHFQDAEDKYFAIASNFHQSQVPAGENMPELFRTERFDNTADLKASINAWIQSNA